MLKLTNFECIYLSTIPNFCLDILLFVYPFHLSEGILFKIIAFHKFFTIVFDDLKRSVRPWSKWCDMINLQIKLDSVGVDWVYGNHSVFNNKVFTVNDQFCFSCCYFLWNTVANDHLVPCGDDGDEDVSLIFLFSNYSKK